MPTPPTVDELAEYLSVSPDDAGLSDLLADAQEIVDDKLGSRLWQCPPRTYRLGIRLVAKELDTRRTAAGGVLQVFSEGGAVRMGRDLWVSSGAAAVLGPHLPLGASG